MFEKSLGRQVISRCRFCGHDMTTAEMIESIDFVGRSGQEYGSVVSRDPKLVDDLPSTCDMSPDKRHEIIPNY